MGQFKNDIGLPVSTVWWSTLTHAFSESMRSDFGSLDISIFWTSDSLIEIFSHFCLILSRPCILLLIIAICFFIRLTLPRSRHKSRMSVLGYTLLPNSRSFQLSRSLAAICTYVQNGWFGLLQFLHCLPIAGHFLRYPSVNYFQQQLHGFFSVSSLYFEVVLPSGCLLSNLSRL